MRGHRILVALCAIVLLVVAVPASAKNPKAEQSSTKGFRKAITVAGITEHLEAFQGAADANGGNRVGGSPGYEASADYVTERLEAAGYTVTDHFFDFLFNADRTPPTLRLVAPTPTTYVDGVDFASMTFSGSIPTTTAAVQAVELNIPATPGAPDSGNTSGCEATDFAGFPSGAIALVMRGTCPFGQKVDNATAAGAVATIVMNEGNSDARSGVINGTLGAGTHGPAVGTSYDVGVDFAQGITNGPTGSTAEIRIDRIEEMRTTRNLIAETRRGDPDNVIVVGAHLDSVPSGPGINDNGSGSATILEVAETLAKKKPHLRNKIRFAWWGAEEFNLLGSQAYVDSLSDEELDRIALNLNFDMIASPNYARFIYDGDNSAFPVGPGSADGPEGSGEIERVFTDYFAGQRLASEETPFSGRSDYGPFIAEGIPAGGLFTGAEGTKTPEQVAKFGGTADVAFDHCYHLNCDDLSNINPQGLNEMSDAVAHSVITFGKRNLDKHPLVG